ncbi:MAG: energy-coupling factor transporter ATPase [Firmicutes bacterium]|nr:energy-coupling factor transporter ATPase [Bacillota bacterium]
MLIEVKNLTHIYSEGLAFEQAAVKDVSFSVQPGEFVAVIGHTGSGKSTLIQHINGLLKPSSGCVLADGIDLSGKGREVMQKRHKIGMVFQYPEYQLFEETVLKDVAFAPHRQGLSDEECADAARRALEIVGIDPAAKGGLSPFTLSGGEKRRVAIAGVLAMKPEVLIFDEPTAGLDPSGHEEILGMMRRIREDRNLTIFFVSHNMNDVAEMADRVLVMNRGSLYMNGTPREVFSKEEELKALGLSLPDASSFAKEIGLEALTIEELADKIASQWQ